MYAKSDTQKRDYMISDFNKWLKGEMWERKITQHEMGKLLGITQQAFGQRLRENRFDLKELMIIFHKFDTPPEKIVQLLKY